MWFLFSEYQSDVDVQKQTSDILSQQVDVNKIEVNATDPRIRDKEYDSTRDEDFDENNEKEHFNYGHVDNSQSKYAPKFKHPLKVYNMETKPAGTSVRFRCNAEGK